MSTTGKDPSAALIAGIQTVLDDNVTVGTTTYKVYDMFPGGAPNRQYVHIRNYIDTENGTKGEFVYEGTINVESVDMAGTLNQSFSTVRAMSNKVRELLKTSMGATFTVTGYTLIVFRHAVSTQLTMKGRDGRDEKRIIDIYEFIIE